MKDKIRFLLSLIFYCLLTHEAGGSVLLYVPHSERIVVSDSLPQEPSSVNKIDFSKIYKPLDVLHYEKIHYAHQKKRYVHDILLNILRADIIPHLYYADLIDLLTSNKQEESVISIPNSFSALFKNFNVEDVTSVLKIKELIIIYNLLY